VGDTREPVFRAECRELVAALRRHPTLTALHASHEWPALDGRLRTLLSTVRRSPPGHERSDLPQPGRVRAVHWNIEHGNWFGLVERAMREHPGLARADLLTLNEVDLGMARADNRDVAADLAGTLGLHAAWAPLFLETTLGRHEDEREAGGRENQESLFGLAILSRWPIGETRIVELPSPTRYQYDSEGMYGRFIALTAVIERPFVPFLAVTTHLEVHRTRGHRAEQMRVLLEQLDKERLPVLLGGDFNSHTFDRGRWWDPVVGAVVLASWPGAALRRRLLWPDQGEAREPLFDDLARAGFEWDGLTDRQPTLHLRFARVPEASAPLAAPLVRPILAWAERRAHLRLDWLAGRGWRGATGATIRGLDGPGRASDHAPVTAEFW